MSSCASVFEHWILPKLSTNNVVVFSHSKTEEHISSEQLPVRFLYYQYLLITVHWGTYRHVLCLFFNGNCTCEKMWEKLAKSTIITFCEVVIPCMYKSSKCYTNAIILTILGEIKSSPGKNDQNTLYTVKHSFHFSRLGLIRWIHVDCAYNTFITFLNFFISFGYLQ